jgi:ferric enterobactin receptor
MHRILVVIVSLFLSLFSFAQEGKNQASGLLIGTIIDSASAEAIANATVKLISTESPALNKQLVSDKNGYFEMTRIVFGVYNLEVTATGFSAYRLNNLHFREERYDFNLGDILMPDSSVKMSEVLIYAEKPLIEMKEGKIIFNVSESALSNGASTAEILKNVPLISNDANGRILLKGKEPKILIDDKPIDLTAQQINDLLESVPGSFIDRIEVMSNPPPQYSSESGGVINIITKKGLVGFSVRLGMSAGTRGEANMSLNVSYRKKKFNLNVNAGESYNRTLSHGNSRRENFLSYSNRFFLTDFDRSNKNLRPNARITSNYDFTKNKQLNVVVNLNGNLVDNSSTNVYRNMNPMEEQVKGSIRRIDNDATNFTPSVSATYSVKTKKTGENLKLIASYNTGFQISDRNYFQEFFLNDNVIIYDSTQIQHNDNKNRSWNLRLNYDKPLNKKISLTTGFSTQWNKNHNVQLTDFLRKGDNVFVNNPIYSNDFNFFQNIYTARAAVTWNMNHKWKMISGFQAEYTDLKFQFFSATPSVSNDYQNLLPNFTLRKDWNKGWNASLVYRNSIRRPGINEQNPAVEYNDPYNIRFGNPSLLPQLADNFDLNGGFVKDKYYINASVGYNKVKDIIQSVRTLLPDTRTETTWQNISDRNEYEASLFGGYTFSKKLKMNASAGYSYNEYSLYDKTVNFFRNGATFYTNFTANYIMNDKVSFDANVRYNDIADAQGRSTSNVLHNFGVKTKWLKKKLTVNLNLIDLLSQQAFTTYLYNDKFAVKTETVSQSRNIRLSANYNLNMASLKKKAAQKAVIKSLQNPKKK